MDSKAASAADSGRATEDASCCFGRTEGRPYNIIAEATPLDKHSKGEGFL